MASASGGYVMVFEREIYNFVWDQRSARAFPTKRTIVIMPLVFVLLAGYGLPVAVSVPVFIAAICSLSRSQDL
jgi:hypothetical protein